MSPVPSLVVLLQASTRSRRNFTFAFCSLTGPALLIGFNPIRLALPRKNNSKRKILLEFENEKRYTKSPMKRSTHIAWQVRLRVFYRKGLMGFLNASAQLKRLRNAFRRTTRLKSHGSCSGARSVQRESTAPVREIVNHALPLCGARNDA